MKRTPDVDRLIRLAEDYGNDCVLAGYVTTSCPTHQKLEKELDEKLKSRLVPQFILDQVFNKLERNGEVYYWRECASETEGYIVLYSDGNHLHTYHHPENFL